jgi:hypothetical protein
MKQIPAQDRELIEEVAENKDVFACDFAPDELDQLSLASHAAGNSPQTSVIGAPIIFSPSSRPVLAKISLPEMEYIG